MALIGLRDLYIAILTNDSPESTVYAEPVRVVGAITANINPNSSSSTLFADDGPMDTAATLGEIELEIGVADIPLEQQALILGHNYDSATGILSKGANDIAPWLAVGFRSLKSDGSYRYYWLTKGKFSTPEEDIETKGDSVNFKTPTVTGKFAKRLSDDKWEITADSSNTKSAEIITKWFTAETLNVPAA